jgi:hypothetical protein
MSIWESGPTYWLNQILEERQNQDGEWGGKIYDRKNSSHDWMVYIMKQLGKASDYHQRDEVKRIITFQNCMIKIAALALAALEASSEWGTYLDR